MYTRAMARPSTGGPTKTRGIRIPDWLWTAAQEKAAAEGTNVSALIVGFLTRYVATPPKERRPPKS